MEVTNQGLDVFRCDGTLKGTEIKPSPKTLTVGKQAKPPKAEVHLQATANHPDVSLQTLDIFAGMLLSKISSRAVQGLQVITSCVFRLWWTF